MSYYGKKYVLASQENFDSFLNAFGDIPEEVKKALLNHKPALTLTKDGDRYTLKTTHAGDKEQVQNFQSGVEFDEKLSDLDVKTTITVDGNTYNQVQKGANGVSFSIKRVFSDDQVVATMTSSVWDGVATRVYKAV